METDIDRLFLNETPDAVIITTPEGEVVYWNKGAETVFGYGRDEVVGRSLVEIIVPPDRLQEEHQFFQKTLEAGSCTYESIRRRKDVMDYVLHEHSHR